VTAAPWAAQAVPTCTIGVLCEAEDLSLNGVSVASDHSGYTGRGFAAGFQNTGNSLSFQVNVTTAGTYQFDARYANALGGDGQDTTRTLTVSADGGSGQTLTMPATADWNTWAIASTELALPGGTHTITVARTASDSGNVDIDSLALVTPGSPYPAPRPPTPQNCQFGTVCEAESGTLGGSASVASDHNDYSGTGFVAGLQTGASDTMHVVGVPPGRHLRAAAPLRQRPARTPLGIGPGRFGHHLGHAAHDQQLGLLAHGGRPGPPDRRHRRRHDRLPGREQLPAQHRHRRGDQPDRAAARPACPARRLPAQPGRGERLGAHHARAAVSGRLDAAGRHHLGHLQRRDEEGDPAPGP
jgi:hypothetical protein